MLVWICGCRLSFFPCWKHFIMSFGENCPFQRDEENVYISFIYVYSWHSWKSSVQSSECSMFFLFMYTDVWIYFNHALNSEQSSIIHVYKYNVGLSLHSISHRLWWKWEKWGKKERKKKWNENFVMYRICETVRVGQGADIPFVQCYTSGICNNGNEPTRKSIHYIFVMHHSEWVCGDDSVMSFLLVIWFFNEFFERVWLVWFSV